MKSLEILGNPMLGLPLSGGAGPAPSPGSPGLCLGAASPSRGPVGGPVGGRGPQEKSAKLFLGIPSLTRFSLATRGFRVKALGPHRDD